MKKTKGKPSKFPLLTALLILGAINLFFVDGWLVLKFFNPNSNVLGETTSCPQSCINIINQSGSGGSAAKEYFVPLGTGTNKSDDWLDVEGAQSYIDSTQYRKIKKVTFEATLEIPNGAQISYVRLYNVTDKHPVWFSEMNMDGSGPQLLISAPISLDPGQKLYKVQMKSQLKGLINLVQSRVHILTY